MALRGLGPLDFHELVGTVLDAISFSRVPPEQPMSVVRSLNIL